MNIHCGFVRVSIILLALLPFDGIAQEVPLARAPAAPPAVDFGFADLMNLLIQPRHIKLHRAASARHWELAAAESRNLRAGFNRISNHVPKYLGNDVAEVVRQLFEPHLMEMDKAIAAADAKRVAAAYAGLTAACNECHVYMEHPFIVIKVPEDGGTDAFADQDFQPHP